MTFLKNLIKIGHKIMYGSWIAGVVLGIFLMFVMSFWGAVYALFVTIKIFIVGYGITFIAKLFMEEEEYDKIVADYKAAREAKKNLHQH